MKKMILAAGALALLAGMTSCGNSAISGKSAEDKAFDDSLTVSWGYLSGAQAAEMIEKQPGESIDKAAFLRGMQTALSIDTADQSYIQGLTMGLRVAQQRTYAMKQLGCDVDADKWMAEFKKAFYADSLPNVQMLGMEFQQLAQRAETRAQERKMEELANSPEALANVEEGEKFIASLKNEDPTVQVSPSGLVYKIEAEGEGDPITDKDRVYVNYTGKFINGNVFDSSKDRPASFSPRSVVPGFGEGLKLLKKGGKATLYIPGNLGYGPQGQPGAGIGPNEMLIFDVEVVSVNEAPDAKK